MFILKFLHLLSIIVVSLDIYEVKSVFLAVVGNFYDFVYTCFPCLFGIGVCSFSFF